MGKKKRKKKWTTKNTHIRRYVKNENYVKPEKWYDKLASWIFLIAAIIFIFIVASNNHIVGYDHFVGIPREWVHSLLK